MRLHLDSSISGPADTRASSVTAGGSSSTARSAGGGGSRDSISISGTATALNQIAADRATRIQQISDAVRSGVYQVSSATIASAMVTQASV
jgi:anti-sigma28 factor (negative regulator of flagellin synthesis)